MKSKCPKCKGSGRVIKEKMTCPTCLGIGKTSFTLGSGKESQPCEKCKGTGKIVLHDKCPVCKGNKSVQQCTSCGKITAQQTQSGLCKTCENRQIPVVYSLKPPIDSQLVRKNMHLLTRVESVKQVGVFVQAADNLNVLIRSNDVTQDYAWDRGEEVIVKVSFINEKGQLFGVPLELKEYVVESLRGRVRKLEIQNLNEDMVGSFISIEAQVVSILQTSGPTRFTMGFYRCSSVYQTRRESIS